jgi:hypothetical protein
MSDREFAFGQYLSRIGGTDWTDTQVESAQADFNAGADWMRAFMSANGEAS